MGTAKIQRTGDTGRTYVAIDRVSRIMAGHDYVIVWSDLATQHDAVIYYRDPLAKPGKLGHPPVWEVHFTRTDTSKSFRFVIAFKRVSSGDGRNDVTVRLVRLLPEAVRDSI